MDLEAFLGNYWISFSIWGEESINRGLDGLMTRKLASIGMIPLPYGEEVWADLGDGIYALVTQEFILQILMVLP